MTLVNSRLIRGRCPTCGAAHAVCGTTSESVAVDERMEVAVMGGPLKRYTVTTPAGVETTMKLNEDDAKRLGVLDVSEDPPSADKETTQATGKSRLAAPRNKARTVADKDGGTGGGD